MISEVVDKDIDDPYPLPAWADKFLGGHIEKYAQLSTRDGRLTGNGVVVEVMEETFADVTLVMYAVLTDFGNVIRVSQAQVERQFYPPVWRMRKELVDFRRQSMAVYLLLEKEIASAIQ